MLFAGFRCRVAFFACCVAVAWLAERRCPAISMLVAEIRIRARAWQTRSARKLWQHWKRECMLQAPVVHSSGGIFCKQAVRALPMRWVFELFASEPHPGIVRTLRKS